MKCAFFSISGKTYAAPMDHFSELREPSEMRELPEPHPPFLGWAVERDALCPIIDFAPLLGGIRPTHPMWLFIDDNEQRICVVIDGPATWQSVDDARLVRKPPVNPFPQDYLLAMIDMVGSAPVPLVDLKRFLSAGDAIWLRQQLAALQPAPIPSPPLPETPKP